MRAHLAPRKNELPVQSGNDVVLLMQEKESETASLVITEDLMRDVEKRLPPPPHLVMEILRKVQDPNVNFDDLTKLLQKDPSFIAKVFKYAGKVAREADKGPVDSIKRAVELLGTEKLRRIAMTVSLVSVLEVKRSNDFDIEVFWRESFSTGVAAEILCQIARIKGKDGQMRKMNVDPSMAFIAGVISNIGELYMALYHGKPYVDALCRVSDRTLTSNVLAVERKSVGIDHCAFGAAIAKLYHLPDSLLEPIEHHHNYEGIMQRSHLTQLVILGRIIGLLASRPRVKSYSHAYQTLDRDLSRYFHVPKDRLDLIVQKTHLRVHSTAALFNIHIPIEHAQLVAEVSRIRTAMAREAEHNKAVFEFTERPEDYLPCSISEMYMTIDSMIDPTEKVRCAFRAIEHLLAVMALLAAVHYENGNQHLAKAYKKFREDMNRELGMGAWGSLLSSAVADLKASKSTQGTFLATDFERIDLAESEIFELRSKRNVFLHSSGKTHTREQKRALANEVDLHVDKIISNAMVFYHGYFFFVEQTKLRKDSMIEYVVRKWQGNLREHQLRTATICTQDKLFVDDEVYFYDTKQDKVLRCGPYLLRRKSPVTGEFAVYLLKYVDLKKQKWVYESFSNAEDALTVTPSTVGTEEDSFNQDDFVLGT